MLVCDPKRRTHIGKNAINRAKTFTWDDSAKRVIKLIQKLKTKQRMSQFFPKKQLSISFVKTYDEVQAHLVSYTELYEKILSLRNYQLSLLEGIALTLLRNHSSHEIELILQTLCENPEEAQSILSGCAGLMDAIS